MFWQNGLSTPGVTGLPANDYVELSAETALAASRHTAYPKYYQLFSRLAALFFLRYISDGFASALASLRNATFSTPSNLARSSILASSELI